MSLSQLVPLVHVNDMSASLAFYVDGLGFERTEYWPAADDIRWCNVKRDDVDIMLQKAAAPEAGTGIVTCIFCEDALALYRAFRENGVQPEEPFVGNRLWVVRVRDPDGYIIDFESPTDEPEETKLSDIEGS